MDGEINVYILGKYNIPISIFASLDIELIRGGSSSLHLLFHNEKDASAVFFHK